MKFVIKIKNELKHFIDNKAEKNIFRNIVKLVAGDGIARIIGFITTPIITRIYLPEQVGVLSVFISLLALMAPFSTFRYTLAIPLPKNEHLAFNLAVLSFIILCGGTIIIFIAYPFVGEHFLNTLSIPHIVSYWPIIPIAFWCIGLYEILSQWAVRKKNFSTLARTKVTQKLTGSISKIALGICGLESLGLLIGEIFTQTGGVLSLSKSFINDFKSNLASVKKSTLRFLSLYYIDFPKYRLLSNLFIVFAAKAPLLYFAWKYGTELTGQIGLSITMLCIPMAIVGNSVGKAFYAEIATIGRKAPEEIFVLTRSIIMKMFGISLIPFIVLFVTAPWGFKIFFGEMWFHAGIYARILSFCMLMQFVYSPVSDGIVNVINRQDTAFVIDITRVIMIVIIFLMSHFLQWTTTLTLIVYSIGLTIHYFIAIYMMLRIIKLSKI